MIIELLIVIIHDILQYSLPTKPLWHINKIALEYIC